LPFQVADVDSDSITLFYGFDSVGGYSEAAGSVFADLYPSAGHTMEVLAFDGYDESQPVTYALLNVLEKVIPALTNLSKSDGSKLAESVWGRESHSCEGQV
jgi:hypothetical protein